MKWDVYEEHEQFGSAFWPTDAIGMAISKSYRVEEVILRVRREFFHGCIHLGRPAGYSILYVIYSCRVNFYTNDVEKYRQDRIGRDDSLIKDVDCRLSESLLCHF